MVERSERLDDIEFNIQFTKKALDFIRSKGFTKPSIMINIDYIRTGCCVIPRLVVDLADTVDAGVNFLKLETSAGIPIYVRRELIDAVVGNKRSFDVDTTGSWRREITRQRFQEQPARPCPPISEPLKTSPHLQCCFLQTFCSEKHKM